jgi:hypothetical protein
VAAPARAFLVSAAKPLPLIGSATDPAISLSQLLSRAGIRRGFKSKERNSYSHLGYAFEYIVFTGI